MATHVEEGAQPVVDDNFREKLKHNVFVGDICPQLNQIISCNLNDTIEATFEKLLNNNITSLPIFDKERGGYIGFIDLFDIFKFIEKDVLPKTSDLTDEDLSKKFSSHDIKYVLDTIEKRLAFPVVKPDAPIQEAINKLACDGVYRLAVFSDLGLESVITQSRIVRWLSRRTEKDIGYLTNRRISSLPIGSENIFKVKKNSQLLDAFNLIREHKISGVAVVDDNDNIVGNISMSDIKSFGSRGEFLRLLKSTCGEYIEGKKEGHPVPHLVSIQESSTLGEVLDLLRMTFVHRIYVTREEKIVKIITLTDILKLFRE